MVAVKLGPAERALIEFARVALSNDDEGLRQLCRRFIRRPPTELTVAPDFKAELSAVLAAAPNRETSPLRKASARDVGPAKTEDSEVTWVQHPRLDRAPTYSVELADAVTSLISEHEAPERLVSFGLSPSRTVLFTGPPGVGKTLTASYVSSQLQLPLITLNLASLMSSFMGRTGQNLQDIVNKATQQPCVLFLDEFDALAKNRDDNSDVGEVKRLVNVVLQQLDRWPPGSLLIAATNHPQLLDPAVHRRFDITIQFELPEYDARLSYIRDSEIIRHANMDEEATSMLALVSDGWSPAEIQNWVNRTARHAIVNSDAKVANHESVNVSDALLNSAGILAQRWVASSKERRAELAYLTATKLGWPHRRIGDWLGVSHVTVGKDINQYTDNQ